MEFLDVTSIRDTRFGKFAKIPKVSAPRSSHKVQRARSESLLGVGSPDEWVLGSSGQGADQLAWILRLGIPAPKYGRLSGKCLLPLAPHFLIMICLHLPKTCEKIEGTDSWKQDSLS